MLKQIVASLLVAGAAITMGGQALAQPSEGEPIKGGTAIVILGTDPKTLNPTVNTGSPDLTVGCQIHDGLVEVDSAGNAVPALAKSWTISDDSKTYTFQLNEANWHDGKPFTAKDVAFFFNEVTKYAPLIAAQVGKKIEKVEILGDHEISVTLTEPYGPFLSMTACFNGGGMIPEHIYAGSNPPTSPDSLKPIGTGPFKFVEWRPGDSIHLEKNPDYFREGLPHLDGWIARIIPSGAARVQALKAGDGDFIQRFYLPTADIDMIAADPNLQVQPSNNPPNILFGFFNTTKGYFADAAVRKALFSVVDRNFISQAVYANKGQPGQAPFGKLLGWAAHDGINYDEMFPRDFDAANKALDEAGLKRDANGVRFSTDITFDAAVAEYLGAATAIQSAWRELGVNVELRSMEQSVLLPRIFEEKDFGVTLWVYTTYGDPAVGLGRSWITSSIGRPYGNASSYSNPKVDELFALGASQADNKARGDYYRQVQEILADEMPAMTLYETGGFHAASAKLKGAWGFVNNGRWSHAWFDK